MPSFIRMCDREILPRAFQALAPLAAPPSGGRTSRLSPPGERREQSALVRWQTSAGPDTTIPDDLISRIEINGVNS